MGALLRAIDAFDATFVVASARKLAPLLFVRPGELRAAEWTEFDLKHPDGARWSIPAARRKLRKAQKEDPRTPPPAIPAPAGLHATAITWQWQSTVPVQITASPAPGHLENGR